MGPAEQSTFDQIVENSKLSNEIPSANTTLQSDDIARLRHPDWLNNEIINSSSSLINKRNSDRFNSPVQAIDVHESKRPRTYTFNTLFYAQLSTGHSKYDHGSVTNWTNRAGIEVMQMDPILIPINRRNKHWVLASIDLFRKGFGFIDPMKEDNRLDVMKKLNQWLVDKVRTKLVILVP